MATAYDVLDYIIVWTIAALSIAMIFFVLTRTIADIKKGMNATFVMKDSLIVYFTSFIIFSLAFKISIIDSFYKGSIDKRRSCSGYFSSYVP